MRNIIGHLSDLSFEPADEAGFNKWLQQEDAFSFLIQNAKDSEFVIYASIGHTYIHAVLVGRDKLSPPDISDLMGWNCNSSSCWGVSYTLSDPPRVWLSPPLEHPGCKTLVGAEKLIYSRHFEGLLGDKSYYEVLQKFIHVFDLHFVPEKNAYCRIDKLGDVEEVLRIVRVNSKIEGRSGTIITVHRNLIDQYMALTDTYVVRLFDFTRYRSGSFSGWSSNRVEKSSEDPDFSYRMSIEKGKGSYARGFQVVRPTMAVDVILRGIARGDDEERNYATFLIQDWKNSQLVEVSCAPGHTANYFTESDLPFEVSPAFFRPEVLAKYKADPEKYRLEDRSITCRGAWYLKTYDVNEHGQIHTYIVYLRDLPYEEQLHWKAYNEKPKGPISKRAFTTDIEGDWHLDYEPLNSIKAAAREFSKEAKPWWSLREEGLLDQVHYPVTSSAEEWATELLHLDQLIVEGYEEKNLRRAAMEAGRQVDTKMRSLKLIEEWLVGLGYEEDGAKSMVAPLRNLHNLRSKIKGHASGQEAVNIKKQVLQTHGSYRKHFENLCAECDSAFRDIHAALKGGQPSANL